MTPPADRNDPTDAARARRILLVTSFPFPGSTGSPLHAMLLTRAMAARGHEITVLRYGGRRAPRVDRASWHGINVSTVPMASWPRFLLRTLREMRPSVVWTHGGFGLLVAMPFARARGIPILHEAHALPGPARAGASLRTRTVFRAEAQIELRAPRLADGVIALSERMADAMVRAGIRRERLSVSYPPVDLAAVRGEPRAPAASAPIVAYVGNFWFYQGVSLLLEAIPLVLAERPDVRFQLVGGSPEDLDANARERLRAAGDSVAVVPRIDPDDVPAVLRGADVLVIPRPDIPINRTTARKLGEYLASGRILVATDVADHRRLIEERSCGIVVRCDAADLAAGLLRAVQDRAASGALARRAVEVAEEVFSLDRAVSHRERRIAELVGEGS